MKRSLSLALLHSSLALSALALTSSPVHAQSTRKECEALKSEIAERLDAKGVRDYQLQIVEPEAETLGRIVGSCNGGTARIVYRRAAAETPGNPPANATRMPAVAALETLAQHEM